MDKIFTADFLINLIIFFVVLLFSLSLHESAHAWTSEKFGDPTGRYHGRITLNPIAHIDLIGTILIPLIGYIGLSGSFALIGWAKPVMVNPLMWREKKRANIAVSLAGPASNFILFVIALFIIKALLVTEIMAPGQSLRDLVVPSAGQPSYLIPIGKILSIMMWLNLSLGIFNLIPIPPLDGSHILESLLPYEMARAYEQLQSFGWIILLVLVNIGVLSIVIRPFSRLVLLYLFGI